MSVTEKTVSELSAKEAVLAGYRSLVSQMVHGENSATIAMEGRAVITALANRLKLPPQIVARHLVDHVTVPHNVAGWHVEVYGPDLIAYRVQ